VIFQQAYRRHQVIHGCGRRRFAGQQQNMLHAGARNGACLGFDLRQAQLAARNGMGPVEAAIYALVAAVIRDVQRDEELNGTAEVLHGQLPGFVRHGFETRRCRRAQKRQQIHVAQPFLR